MNSELEPKLGPPGAGLPAPELFIARILFGINRATGSRHSFTAAFQHERELIRRLVRDLQPSQAAQRVLIDRLRGLEDSSRFWSVWMTLEHLRIVHTQIARVIEALSREIRLKGAASTAAVKPNSDVTESVLSEYENSCDNLLKIVDGISDLKTKTRYPHPWFGPLDAAGWHALAARHLRIHRRQIEKIIQHLPARTIDSQEFTPSNARH